MKSKILKTNISRFLNVFPGIYCLSLTSSAERREYMQSFAKIHALTNMQFIDAATPACSDVKALYADNLVHRFPNCFRCGNLTCGDSSCNNTLIPVQVATFASYLRVFRKFLESGKRYALFIEDDIKLAIQAENLCGQALENNYAALAEFQSEKPFLMQFGWAYGEEHESIGPIDCSSFMGKMSNPAFALNRAMAKLILSKFQRVSTTVDIFIHRECASESNAKTFFPPLFYEMSWSTGEVESTIHPKAIRVDYLKASCAESHEVAQAVEKLESHQKHTSVYPLLIIGHPRCGSGYSAKLCQAAGLQVGHEKLLEDGICSWMFATEDDCPWALNEGARSRRLKYFENVAMHVRNPRTAVASIMRDNEHSAASYEFRKKHIFSAFNVNLDEFADNFTRAVASYIYWNKLVLAQHPHIIFRVEDEGEKLVTFLQESGNINDVAGIEYPRNDVNANKKYQGKTVAKPDVNLAAFSRLPEALLGALNLLCERFGYEEFKVMKEFDKQGFIKKVEVQTLEPMGWIRSAEEQISVDKKGALPLGNAPFFARCLFPSVNHFH